MGNTVESETNGFSSAFCQLRAIQIVNQSRDDALGHVVSLNS